MKKFSIGDKVKYIAKLPRGSIYKGLIGEVIDSGEVFIYSTKKVALRYTVSFDIYNQKWNISCSARSIEKV